MLRSLFSWRMSSSGISIIMSLLFLNRNTWLWWKRRKSVPTWKPTRTEIVSGGKTDSVQRIFRSAGEWGRMILFPLHSNYGRPAARDSGNKPFNAHHIITHHHEIYILCNLCTCQRNQIIIRPEYKMLLRVIVPS